MKIVLVRHGETNFNKEKRIQGKQQISLNENGRTQAIQAAESLREYKITHIYCSSLVRAIETAEIINKSFLLPLLTDDRLNERDWGTWENRIRDDILNQNPELGNSLYWMSLDANPHQGETARELMNRSIGFLRHLVKIHAETDVILVITHGGPLRMMWGFVKGMHPEEHFPLEIENSQVFKVKYENSTFVLE